MKSLSYRFLNKDPRNWDDCVNYCHCHLDLPARPEISLTLKLKEQEYCALSLISFAGEYCWVFPDGTRTVFEKDYSRVCEYEALERRELMRLIAVEKLQKDLNLFQEHGITVIPKEGLENWYSAETSLKLRCS